MLLTSNVSPGVKAPQVGNPLAYDIRANMCRSVWRA